MPISDESFIVRNKPKTRKGKRILEAKGSQVHEPTKNVLLLRGTKLSADARTLLDDLHTLLKPNTHYLSSRNQTGLHPFEDVSSAEYLCEKHSCPLVCMASSSKKRPFRLFVGRMFHNQLLDAFEFSVANWKSAASFTAQRRGTDSSKDPILIRENSKPMIIFQGPGFHSTPEMKAIKNVLCDLFRGCQVSHIDLTGVDHAMVFTAIENKHDATMGGDNYTIRFSHYYMDNKNPSSNPIANKIVEYGPSFDLYPDRLRLADVDTWKLAMKQPSETKPKKKKNISTNVFGETRGRIHLGKQNYSAIHTPHHHGDSGAKVKRRRIEQPAAKV